MRPQGRLDPLASGYSAPIDSPLYERRPSGWVYRDTQFTAVTFETDEEAVLDILPAPLRPAHTPPRATIVVLECRDSTFGAYDEIKFEVAVELGGKVFRYCPYIMVGALDGTLAPDAAMAMGREVLGVPKKIGRIRVRREADQVAVSLERPIGTAIVTVSVSPREAVSPAEAGLATDTPVVHLRLIPSVEEGPPSVAELVRWDTVKRVDPEHVRRGPGSVRYGSSSTEDPWHRLPAHRVLQAVTFRGDLDIPPTGQVVLEYTTLPR